MHMIVEYHRPSELSEALNLLARKDPLTIPIGGGSVFKRDGDQRLAVVDLQSLGLNRFQVQGNTLNLGAALTLQRLLDELDMRKLSGMSGLSAATRHEAAYNLRQVGSVAGTLVAANGRSPFTTAMLALDAVLTLEPGSDLLRLGDLLPLRSEKLHHRLITQVSLASNVRMAYEYVARSPADRPIVCAAAAVWPSGRTRVALGGYGTAPILVFDGTEAAGAELAARSAYSQAGDDWGSAEYRQEMAGVLTNRAVQSVSKG
jgi:CO/xanthine dehydrogenase FAD-binding subunit